MGSQLLLFYLCIAGAAGLFTYGVAKIVLGKRDFRLSDRLRTERLVEPTAPDAKKESSVKNIASKFSQFASKPFMPKKRETTSAIRKNLAMAGIYAPAAIKAMTGFKLILLSGGLIVGTIVGLLTGLMFLGLALGGLIGYLTPQMWLRSKITENQKMLQYGLPDALDLMVVCVEAGLTVDSAMQRVGEEMIIAHPAIAREFGIAHMETRVGLSRGEALKNMGIRTGNAPIQQLVAMLVQSERFGTSIGSALRVQSEMLRIKRQAVAEEMAAKASVKMSFPLVLFIFPATFIVLAGPTILGLMAADLK